MNFLKKNCPLPLQRVQFYAQRISSTEKIKTIECNTLNKKTPNNDTCLFYSNIYYKRLQSIKLQRLCTTTRWH